MKKILIIVTNHSTLGDTEEQNGTYLPELTHAVHEFNEQNIDYDIASITGGNAPLYGIDTPEDSINTSVYENSEFKSKIEDTKKVLDLDFSTYDAIYYPGGYGLLTDIASHEELGKKSAQFFESSKPLGSVCHGPAALLPITLSNGSSILEGREVTGFTREEEIEMETLEKIPYLLEESLTRKAKLYKKMQPWSEHVIVDDNLITGQNPQSAAKVAKEIINQL